MEWQKIEFNVQNIEVETEKAALIKMPKNSAYAGYMFWHPLKLVRTSNLGKGYFKTFSFTNEFKFKLIKNGNGKYNSREVISEVTLSAEEMIDAWN